MITIALAFSISIWTFIMFLAINDREAEYAFFFFACALMNAAALAVHFGLEVTFK